ncbi:MAG: translation initiation factor eIF-1A [Candidatus Poseidoniales archaeon]|nr:MAG: translation initiation factor eIF-1A [Candidatus Poseidoniales archaeon]
MGRRREEKVDEEELARLESVEGDTSVQRIRVKMPNSKVNEMFALAEQILGGRRVNVLCADGEMRLARIPGKMRRRQWVREGDLIIVWPWDFQDSKADVKHRYTKTQAMYLSRKGVLPDVVDLFGTSFSGDDYDEDDDLFGDVDEGEAVEEEGDDDLFGDDGDDDDLFGDDGDDDEDDLFGSDDDAPEPEAQAEPEAEPAPEVTPISFEEDESDDDVTDGVDELFG